MLNPLDLNIIGRRIEANAYSCLEAFWADVKWIAHNTKIHRSGEWQWQWHSNVFFFFIFSNSTIYDSSANHFYFEILFFIFEFWIMFRSINIVDFTENSTQ